MSIAETLKKQPHVFTGNVNTRGEEAPKIPFGVYLDARLVILEQSYIFN